MHCICQPLKTIVIYLFSFDIVGYVSKLMDIVFSNARESKISQVEVERMEAPPPLYSSFEKPDKASAILEMKSRYRQAENVDEMNDDGCC